MLDLEGMESPTQNSQRFPDHKLMFGRSSLLPQILHCQDGSHHMYKLFPVLTGSVEKGNLGAPQLPGQGCSFHSFSTSTYKLSFMENPTGIKIILVTHPKTGDLRESFEYIYSLYVEYVVKNPVYTPGTSIRCELFNTNLDQYVRNMALVH